jgi:hypothetical protein
MPKVSSEEMQASRAQAAIAREERAQWRRDNMRFVRLSKDEWKVVINALDCACLSRSSSAQEIRNRITASITDK